MRKLFLSAILCIIICDLSAQDLSLGKPAFIGAWHYFVRNDPKGAIKLAIIDSQILRFQDSSGSTSLLLIQQESGELQIALQNEVGHFSKSIQGNFVTLKFDNKPLVKWKITRGTKGNQHILFINNEKSFYEQLLKTHKLSIKAYFDDSLLWMTYEVDGFSMHNVRVKNAEW